MRTLTYYADEKRCSSCASSSCHNPLMHGHVDWTRTYEMWVASDEDV